MDPFESPDMARHPASVDRDRRRTATDEADHTLRIYLIEDSPVIRENLIATLEEMAPVTVVGSADTEGAATAWLQSHAPQDCRLVIVDIFLKGGSGLGVLRAMTDSHAGRKLVVLSNYATPEMRERCMELGADRVFDKSDDIDALIDYCTEIAAEDEPRGGHPLDD
jgi:DNA-binding NarL/FixJ family response regulator